MPNTPIYKVLRLSLIALALYLATPAAHAVRLLWDVDFLTDFDNREYHSDLDNSQTIFGIRLTPTIGLELRDSLSGRHRLMAGASYIQPFGAGWRKAQVQPTVYYRYDYRGFAAALGFVPYSQLKAPLPKLLRSDSLAFVYPNIQGALFQYQNHLGYVEALCDWRGMQQASVREAFRIIVDGEARWNILRAGGFAQLNHLANVAEGGDDVPYPGVADDAIVSPYIGVDASHLTVMDSLRFTLGYIFGYQRYRREELLNLCHGLSAQFVMRWRWLELDDQFYFGDNQMPHYSKFGQLLNQGEKFYQSKIYNSAEIRFRVVRFDFAQLYFAWNMIYTYGEPLSHQQRVVLRFDVNQDTRFRKPQTRHFNRHKHSQKLPTD